MFGIFNRYSFCDEMISGVGVLNIYRTKFSKLIFNAVLSYEVPDVHLQKFIVCKRIWTRYYQNSMLISVDTYMCQRIYFYRSWISAYYFYRTSSSLFHSMMTDGNFFLLKKRCLTLKCRILFAFLVGYGLVIKKIF